MRICLAMGGVYDFDNPEASRFTLGELAYACSTLVRFTGHANPPMTILHHQLLVETILYEQGLGPEVRLSGLVHDLHEAIVGDVATPIKHVLGPKWSAFERQTETMVANALGLPYHWVHPQVKKADLIALATECRDCLHIDPDTWNLGVRPREQKISHIHPLQAQIDYVSMVADLKTEINTGIPFADKRSRGPKLEVENN